MSVLVPDVLPSTAEEFAERIRGHQARGVEAVVAIGREFIAAQQALGQGAVGRVAELAGMTTRNMSRYVAVARNEAIPEIGHACPISLAALEHLARIPGDQLRAECEAGNVTPDMTGEQSRVYVDALLKRNRPKAPDVDIDEPAARDTIGRAASHHDRDVKECGRYALGLSKAEGELRAAYAVATTALWLYKQMTSKQHPHAVKQVAAAQLVELAAQNVIPDGAMSAVRHEIEANTPGSFEYAERQQSVPVDAAARVSGVEAGDGLDQPSPADQPQEQASQAAPAGAPVDAAGDVDGVPELAPSAPLGDSRDDTGGAPVSVSQHDQGVDPVGAAPPPGSTTGDGGARTSPPSPEPEADEWVPAIGHPARGGAGDAHAVTVESRFDLEHMVYRGACVGEVCDWRGEVRYDENIAVEDAHDHVWPAWRDLPIVDRVPRDAKKLPAWIDAARTAIDGCGLPIGTLPGSWLERGGPIVTTRTANSTRHVPSVTPWGGYDLARVDVSSAAQQDVSCPTSDATATDPVPDSPETEAPAEPSHVAIVEPVTPDEPDGGERPSTPPSGYAGAGGYNPEIHAGKGATRNKAVDKKLAAAERVIGALSLIEDTFADLGSMDALGVWCAAHREHATAVHETFERVALLCHEAALCTEVVPAGKPGGGA